MQFERSTPLDAPHLNLRMIEAENAILRAENFDDELAERDREENRAPLLCSQVLLQPKSRRFDRGFCSKQKERTIHEDCDLCAATLP